MRYIGNKKRMLNRINKFIKKEKITGKVFCDLFAGTGCVGDSFKEEYDIISNDFLYFSAVINKGRILNNKIPAFNKFKKEYKTSPFEYLNKKEYLYNDQYFITNEYSPKGGRQFFTEENAIRVDGMRIMIEQLYKDNYFDEKEYYYLLGSLIESVMGVSNTSGTYEAFLKDWDRRAFKRFNIAPLEINEVEHINKNSVFCLDANDLVRRIEGDILYIDTPYTITEYSSAYHILETLAKYDYPSIHGKTGRRINNDKKSLYSKKRTALNAFEDLIRQAKFSDIIISYSNQSLIDLPELEEMLKKFAVDNKVKIQKYKYREYKNLNASQKGDKLFEVLIHLKKDNKFLKSPLNYSGSKDNLIPSMIPYLPKHITNFVDVMGGAFNVGVNIVAMNKIVYNEYNPFVFQIVEMLINEDKEVIIKNSEQKIEKFNLEKCNKENYLKFRRCYNENQNPLDLFVLQMFCFQNQLRFNSNYKFNTPIGNCAYNETTKERIKNFIPKTKNLEMLNLDFREFNYSKYDNDTLFYFDPPYFITNATYNDGKRGFNGWSADLETELLETLTNLNNLGYKFMLSNVIEHNGKKNNILLEWIETHNFKVIELNHPIRKEVIIINY